MPEALEIALTPERLEDAAPEERACFGRFTIEAAWGSLTAGIDHYIGGYRAGPLVSGYHVAEWFAWNWWRLRYEPRSRAPDWWRAHTMTSIGEGYVWPNLTIYSDGERTVLLSKLSVRPDAKPFRYLGAHPVVLPSAAFEAAVDTFIGQIEGRLLDHDLSDTNLSRIWADLRAERADPTESERRRLEALLARDPDEHEDGTVESLIADTGRLGAQGVAELAAEQGRGGERLVGADLVRLAETRGVPGQERDAVLLRNGGALPGWGQEAAWRIGARAAQALRSQESWGGEPIHDARLAAMAGLTDHALTTPAAAPLAFALDRDDGSNTTVFRSRNHTGRRFELARLIADRIVHPVPGTLHAATRAYTYRQKMQRSFAAELLSPFEAVEAFLDGDYSEDAQQESSDFFNVSPMTIATLLVNHGRLQRDELADALDEAA